MASRVSSCPRTPPPSRGPSIRSWPTPPAGEARHRRPGGRLLVRIDGAGRAAGGRVPAGQGRARRGAEAGRPRAAPPATATGPAPSGWGAPSARSGRRRRRPWAERASGSSGFSTSSPRWTAAWTSWRRRGRAAGRPDLVRTEIAIRNRLRDEAARVRHHLIIQREALGFARQTPVEQCYPVPERRRLPGPAGDRGGSHDRRTRTPRAPARPDRARRAHRIARTR